MLCYIIMFTLFLPSCLINLKCQVDNVWLIFTGPKNLIGPNSSSSYWPFQQNYPSAGGQQRTTAHMLFLSGLNLIYYWFIMFIHWLIIAPFALVVKFKLVISPSFQGVKEFSVPVGLDAKVMVDLVVVGSVAVSEKGEPLQSRQDHFYLPIGSLRLFTVTRNSAE